MKSLLVLSVAIAIAVATPSGFLGPHFQSVGYSSPIHETIVAETPAVVHHKSVVSDIPTAISHQHSSVVHHHSPTVVHEETFVEPAVRHYEFAHAAPAVVHHEFAAPAVAVHGASASLYAHAGPAVVHHEFAHAAPAAGIVAHAAPIVHHEVSHVAHAAPAVLHQQVVAHAAPAVVHHEAAHLAYAAHAQAAHAEAAHAQAAHAQAAHAQAQAAHAQAAHAEAAHAEAAHAEAAHAQAARAQAVHAQAQAAHAHAAQAQAAHAHAAHANAAHYAHAVQSAAVVAHAAPAVVHHEVAHAAPAVVHHKVAAPAAFYQKSIVANVPTAVSEQHSTVVHKSAPIHHTVVAQAPLVHHAVAPVVHRAVAPAVHHTVVAEPIGVKQSVSHQDSTVVHSAAIHHEVPAVHHAVVADVHHAAPISTQYHAQDALGQYSFGYASPLSSKAEVKTLDGITKGGFNYLDAFGKEQSVQYVSDDVHGFRVAASNLPIGPAPVVDTPEVAAAKAAHFSIHENAKAAFAAAKSAEVEHHVYHEEIAPVAPVVPSAYSYSYVAQKPAVHHVSSVVAQPAAIVQDVPVVGVTHDAIAVDANIAPAGFYHNLGFVSGASFPIDTPKVAHAKAAHFAAYRAGAHLKEEKPCD